MSTFFYLGPIRTNESQRAINKQKLPQMTFLGLFRCKQTFLQNVAKFRLIQPSTYEKWHICPLFSISAQYVLIGPIRTNESKRTFNVQKLPPNDFFFFFFLVYLDGNKHFSLQKSTKLYRTPMKFILMDKNYVF